MIRHVHDSQHRITTYEVRCDGCGTGKTVGVPWEDKHVVWIDVFGEFTPSQTDTNIHYCPECVVIETLAVALFV